ncbi:hypothetical protein ACFL04_04995, partial [Patescibacteria group bacterium]
MTIIKRHYPFIIITAILLSAVFIFSPRVNQAIEWQWEVQPTPDGLLGNPTNLKDVSMIQHPDTKAFHGWMVGEPRSSKTTIFRQDNNKWIDDNTKIFDATGTYTYYLESVETIFWEGDPADSNDDEFKIWAVGTKKTGATECGTVWYSGDSGAVWTEAALTNGNCNIKPIRDVSASLNPTQGPWGNWHTWIVGDHDGATSSIWVLNSNNNGDYSSINDLNNGTLQTDNNNAGTGQDLQAVESLYNANDNRIYTWVSAFLPGTPPRGRIYFSLYAGGPGNWSREKNTANKKLYDLSAVVDPTTNQYRVKAVGATGGGLDVGWISFRNWNSSTWNDEALPPNTPAFTGVSGTYDTSLNQYNFWTVGQVDDNPANGTNNGTILYKNHDGSWLRQNSRNAGFNLNGISAASRVKVYAVGDNNSLVANSPGNIFGWGWFGSVSYTPWWNDSYQYRQQLTVTANENISNGETIMLPLDISSYVPAKMKVYPHNDLRIVYWNGSANQEIDRELMSVALSDASKIELRFMVQSDMRATNVDTGYYLYYGNPAAGAPSVDLDQVYGYYEDFSTDVFSSGWNNDIQGNCFNPGYQVSGGKLIKANKSNVSDCSAWDEGPNGTFNADRNWYFEVTSKRTSVGNLGREGLAGFAMGDINNANNPPMIKYRWAPTNEGGLFCDVDGLGNPIACSTGLWSSWGELNSSATRFALMPLNTEFRQTSVFIKVLPGCPNRTNSQIFTWLDGSIANIYTSDNWICPVSYNPGVYTFESTGEWDDLKAWRYLSVGKNLNAEESFSAQNDVADPIGWVSLSCADLGTCELTNFSYGVNISPAGGDAGELSGYAWIGDGDINQYDECTTPANTCATTGAACNTSFDCDKCIDNPDVCQSTGWISFNRADTGNPWEAPYVAGSYIAKFDGATKKVDGWARILSLMDEYGTGWIKLRSTDAGFVSPAAGPYSLCADCAGDLTFANQNGTCQICDVWCGPDQSCAAKFDDKNYACNQCDSCYSAENTGNPELEAVCANCTSCDKYGISIDDSIGRISGFAWSPDLGWLDFTQANYYSSAWLQTQLGDIYTRADIGTGTTPAAPGISSGDVSLCNATYLIQARGTIANFCTAAGDLPGLIDDPLRSFTPDDFVFPGRTTQYTNALGRIDFNNITTITASDAGYPRDCPNVGAPCRVDKGPNVNGETVWRYENIDKSSNTGTCVNSNENADGTIQPEDGQSCTVDADCGANGFC